MRVYDQDVSYACRQYGENEYQKVGIWQVNKPARPGNGRWVIFIHGGAWRDPKITHLSFIPAIKALVNSGGLDDGAISGFASIDYRLSPHPDYPQGPGEPASKLRAARHPDHIQDVQSALALLKDKYTIGEDYILLGHSAGATLAFQLLMDLVDTEQKFPLPAAIVGISGIYDLIGIDERHEGNYAGFITSAFGSDKETWKAASPLEFPGSFKRNWPCSKFTLLAWSSEDTLIDKPEIDSMAAKLTKDGINLTVTNDLTGEHDEVWEQGEQLAKLITLSLAQLQGSF